VSAILDPPKANRPYIPNRLLDIDDFAELAHVSVGTVRDWLRRGIVPKPAKLGRLLRWDPRIVSDWLSEKGA
jgi:predicted DNA-binding transcriptional regulator AlpA